MGSRDRAVTVVFDALEKTWRGDVLTEVVAGVSGESEVTINKRHKGESFFKTLELDFLSCKKINKCLPILNEP